MWMQWSSVTKIHKPSMPSFVMSSNKVAYIKGSRLTIKINFLSRNLIDISSYSGFCLVFIIVLNTYDTWNCSKYSILKSTFIQKWSFKFFYNIMFLTEIKKNLCYKHDGQHGGYGIKYIL